jgi:hypothetical protein
VTTCVYETIPPKKGVKPQYFEIRQSVNDVPLTKHPETGEPIRRAIPGGYGILRKADGGAAVPACGCGKACTLPVREA